eukprot:gene940-254_t
MKQFQTKAPISNVESTTDSSGWESDFITLEEEKTDSSDSDYLP